MLVRRSSTRVLPGLLVVAVLGFGLGGYSADIENRRVLGDRDAKVDALRAEVTRALTRLRDARRTGAAPVTDTTRAAPKADPGAEAGRIAMIDEIKRELQAEMGLVPVRLLRERRRSFVAIYAYDNHGNVGYSTAGYLGNGYFVTAKHAVISLPADDDRRVTSVKVSYRGELIPATIVDAGNAQYEVDLGDWAIIKVRTRVDLPALRVNVHFPYEFADPIFRLGNDYSRGIILSSGYVGERTPNGLVTCLTDGHPGVSGGGVLDQAGDLVGIPIGRMRGDTRFSFILPLHRGMFRRVPSPWQPGLAAAAQAPVAGQ